MMLSFTSAPPTSAPIRLVVFGDGHTVHPSLSTIAGQALAANVDGLITVGDLAVELSEHVQHLGGEPPLHLVGATAQ